MSADKPSEQAMQMARDIGRLFFSDAFGPQPHPWDIRDAAFLIDQGIRNARAEAFEKAAADFSEVSAAHTGDSRATFFACADHLRFLADRERAQ